jgi:hypothetical protein
MQAKLSRIVAVLFALDAAVRLTVDVLGLLREVM